MRTQALLAAAVLLVATLAPAPAAAGYDEMSYSGYSYMDLSGSRQEAAAAQSGGWMLESGLGRDQGGMAATRAGQLSVSVGASSFKPSFVLIGDSITEFGVLDGGWHQLMGKEYVRRADIVNRGFGGYNSRWGTYLIDEVISTFGKGRVKLATLCFGANDAATPESSIGYMSVPLDEYVANLKAMVTKLTTAAGVETVILLTPPPVDDSNWRNANRARDNRRIAAYAAAAVGAAVELGIPYVDLYTGFQREADLYKFYDYDGIHMSPAGNRHIFNGVMWAIKNRAPALQPKALPLHFPAYKKVDAKDPAATFDGLYGYKVDTGVDTTALQAAAAAAAAAAGAGAAAAATTSPAPAAVAPVAPKATAAAAAANKTAAAAPKAPGAAAVAAAAAAAPKAPGTAAAAAAAAPKASVAVPKAAPAAAPGAAKAAAPAKVARARAPVPAPSPSPSPAAVMLDPVSALLAGSNQRRPARRAGPRRRAL